MKRDCNLTGFWWMYVVPMGTSLRQEHPSISKDDFLHFSWFFWHKPLPPCNIIITYNTHKVNAHKKKQEIKLTHFLIIHFPVSEVHRAGLVTIFWISIVSCKVLTMRFHINKFCTRAANDTDNFLIRHSVLNFLIFCGANIG